MDGEFGAVYVAHRPQMPFLVMFFLGFPSHLLLLEDTVSSFERKSDLFFF